MLAQDGAYFDTTQVLDGVIVELRRRLVEAGGQGKWVESVPPR